MCLGFWVNVTNQSYASGSQLQVTTTQNGTTYVTTALASGSANATLTATNSATNSGLFGQVVPPVGFFANVTDLFNIGLKVVFVVSAILVFVALIWGAMQWITSGGEKTKTEAARNRIVSAIVGLVIVLSSFAAITLIVRLLGYSSFNDVLQLLQPGSTSQTQTATDSSQLRNQNLVQ